MSGEKDSFVNIRQSEWQRVQANARRVDDVAANLRQAHTQAERQLRTEFEQRLVQTQQRHTQMEHSLGQMSSDMRRIEQDNVQRLRQINQEFAQQINQQRQEQLRALSDLDRRTQASLHTQRQEYTHLIQDQGQRFASALEAQRQTLQSQITALDQRWQQEKQGKQDRAQHWLQDTGVLLTALAQNYRHEKFCPGELRQLQTELTLAQNNLGHGDFEAAISAAQQTYLRGHTLQMTLERHELEWNAWLEAAKQSAAEVLAACDAQQLAEYVLEAGTEPVKAEVNYWTEGKLAALRALAETEQARLSQADALSLEALQQSQQQSRQQQQQLEALVAEAKDTLLAAQLRNNIGQTIEAALQAAGWSLSDSTYEGEDFRRALHLKLRNLAGDELVTIIRPEPTPDGVRNHLAMHFFDHFSNDERRHIQQAQQVAKLLREEGLNCTEPSCAAGTENRPSAARELLAVDKTRQQR